MREYLVTFRKTVPDDSGHDHRVLQRRAVVTACSEVAAAFAAKAMLCEADGIVDWRLRADTCEVAAIDRHAA
ncbi:hypothetical protein [Methylobacterium aerolatum]|uniref:Neuroendocrine-specific golgi family protein P55 (NESP55) n=1 Tax=Methylobacterium aerolatum TaxID=418708 RepID=A0ABU0I672_9HYPH|nr:hypothetical protein [Methylobacterium aerolatum]MDQ0449129.1 hypothetical protein [Methylobacterium aerolatum]GJD35317.1 hypothetical protein FMGBMHLM_2227 [Methylobacterium aerolatum]